MPPVLRFASACIGLLLLHLALAPAIAHAQEGATQSVPALVRTMPASEAASTRPVNRTAPSEVRPVSYLTDRELIQTVGFMLFGLIVLVIEYLLLRRVNADPDQILRVFSMTLILVGTLIAVSAGFRLEQTAAAIGLFGTVAGYVLGRSDAAKS